MDFVNKVVTVIMIFIMLVLAPLLISYLSTNMTTHRLVLNEVTQFIDRVTDSGTITSQDLDDLYLGVNAHGGVYDVKVERYVKMETEDENGESRVLYLVAQDLSVLNKTDVVKVHIEEIGMSSARRLLWALLKIDNGEFNFSLAGTVR